MTRPKEPGYYHFDGKEFVQRKFAWDSKDVREFFELAQENLDAGFRMTFDPNEEKSLGIVPPKGMTTLLRGLVAQFFNWVKTCPPLPPQECIE